MRVEVLQARAPLGHKRVGDIIENMPAGQAGDLERRGIVRAVAAIDAPVNRTVVPAQMARKGRR